MTPFGRHPVSGGLEMPESMSELPIVVNGVEYVVAYDEGPIRDDRGRMIFAKVDHDWRTVIFQAHLSPHAYDELRCQAAGFIARHRFGAKKAARVVPLSESAWPQA